MRQEDERSERARKALGPSKATAAEARARILSDAKLSGADESDLLGWVVLVTGEEADRGPQAKSFCEDYFRYQCMMRSLHGTMMGMKYGATHHTGPAAALCGDASTLMTYPSVTESECQLPPPRCHPYCRGAMVVLLRAPLRQPWAVGQAERHWQQVARFKGEAPPVQLPPCSRSRSEPAGAVSSPWSTTGENLIVWLFTITGPVSCI